MSRLLWIGYFVAVAFFATVPTALSLRTHVAPAIEAWADPIFTAGEVPADSIARRDGYLCWTWVTDKLKASAADDIDAVLIRPAIGDMRWPEVIDAHTRHPWHRSRGNDRRVPRVEPRHRTAWEVRVAASLVLDPTAIHNADRSFTVTGRISSTAGLKSIAISESLEDGRPSNFGTATVAADGTFSFKDRETFFKRGDFSATAFFTDGTSVQSAPAPYTFYADGHETTVDAAGQPATSITFNKDGSRDVSVLSGGQTLAAGFFDTFQNGSNPGDTFVYDPGHGGGLIRQFRGDGADHDTLSLKGADFGDSIAEVLADAHQFRGVGTVILDPTSGDTVRLGNVSKAELAANRGDIVFHP